MTLPALLALLASGVHKYPFAGRLAALPGAAHAARGVRAARGSVAVELRPNRPFAAIVLLGLLLLAPTIETYQSFRHPQRSEQLAPVLAAVRDEMRPGDRVYVY